MIHKPSENLIEFARQEHELLWRKKLRGHYPQTRKFKQLSKVEMNALLLLGIANPERLSTLFKLPFDLFNFLIANPTYQQFEIPKKRGGQRIIMAPNKHLKKLQQKLNYYLQAYYFIIKPQAVQGFVINAKNEKNFCNILENAKVHTCKNYVLNIDLKDFFPSIKGKQILELFLSPIFDFNEDIAMMLAMICTYQASLPIGAPTSPVISNFICLKLDEDLKNFAEKYGLAFTRYADDLSISGNEKFDNDCISEMRTIIAAHDFEVNEKKFRIAHKNAKQSVTGITVNKKPNVDRKLLKKVRAMLHDMTQNGLENATQKHFSLDTDTGATLRQKFVNKLEGYINFIGQIRGKQDSHYLKLKNGFDGCFW